MGYFAQCGDVKTGTFSTLTELVSTYRVVTNCLGRDAGDTSGPVRIYERMPGADAHVAIATANEPQLRELAKGVTIEEAARKLGWPTAPTQPLPAPQGSGEGPYRVSRGDDGTWSVIGPNGSARFTGMDLSTTVAIAMNTAHSVGSSRDGEVRALREEVSTARALLHENGHYRNVNHVLAVSPEIARNAYTKARTATDGIGTALEGSPK